MIGDTSREPTPPFNANAATTVRSAVAADLEALVDIYNHYVENTAVTFDTQTYDVRERRAWFDAYSESGPHRLFVLALDGAVVGYASASRFNPRESYRTSVETSVYLHPEYTGQGFGRTLYGALLDALTADERLHRAYGGITLPNDASIALHEKLGFRRAGLYREVGYKFGRFWDVARYERDLGGAGE